MSDVGKKKIVGRYTSPGMSKEDADIIYWSLSMRKCYIETGDPTLSAADAKRMGKDKMVRALSTDQMKMLIRIDELMKKCLNRM